MIYWSRVAARSAWYCARGSTASGFIHPCIGESGRSCRPAANRPLTNSPSPIRKHASRLLPDAAGIIEKGKKDRKKDRHLFFCCGPIGSVRLVGRDDSLLDFLTVSSLAALLDVDPFGCVCSARTFRDSGSFRPAAWRGPAGSAHRNTRPFRKTACRADRPSSRMRMWPNESIWLGDHPRPIDTIQ